MYLLIAYNDLHAKILIFFISNTFTTKNMLQQKKKQLYFNRLFKTKE